MPHSYRSVKTAILTGAIGLHYQPIHRLSDGQLLGYEALARWGNVPPPQIAALVEEHSLELLWVRRQLHDIDKILTEIYPPIWISFNLDQKVLAIESLPYLLNTSPHQLGIHVEVLESVKLHPQAVAALKKISHKHILKADDIGSLDHAWIDRLIGEHAAIFHGIKLCQGLTRNILTNPRTAIACRVFLDLAQSCQLETIAEWVESEEQAQQLLAWGCDAGQGSLFGLAKPWEYWREKYHGH
jgi:EAL domain-containing protein (putative c-di-GMP-specific phosphodiesterase class I)